MLNSSPPIDISIAKGIDFLEQHQLQNGAFRSYFSNNDKMEEYDNPNNGWCIQDDSIFTTILLGSSLLFLNNNNKVEQILTKLTDFLLTQRKTGSIWNHYNKNHNLYQLCPFDVDDTACASALLKQKNISFPSNISLLLSNRNRKKLFYTWFTLRFRLNLNIEALKIALREFKNPVKSLIFWNRMECSRNDVDAVVNANVLYYLGKRKETLPIINHIIAIIKKGNEANCDKWYCNIFTVYYFISRNYFNSITEFESIRHIIIDRIMDNLNTDGSFGVSTLDTALAICTLLNLKYSGKLNSTINNLINVQLPAGNWEKSVFYYNGPKKLVGFGSEALNTAICLEALSRYHIQLNKIAK
jgi:hypothetical protein